MLRIQKGHSRHEADRTVGRGVTMSPAESLHVLERYSLVILPALVVAEQFGIPLPAVPALLGFGALVAHGRGSIPLMLGTLAVVALTVDFAWYEFGRRRGARVLTGLCRLSLEPDFCVRRAQNVFARFGASAMLVAKFVPGLTTIVPPLAGVVAVGRIRFALYDLAGVLLWAGLWIGVGYAFSDAGDDITIVDLRTPRDVAAVPHAIPGSLWVEAGHIDQHEAEILRARDLILY